MVDLLYSAIIPNPLYKEFLKIFRKQDEISNQKQVPVKGKMGKSLLTKAGGREVSIASNMSKYCYYLTLLLTFYEDDI